MYGGQGAGEGCSEYGMVPVRQDADRNQLDRTICVRLWEGLEAVDRRISPWAFVVLCPVPGNRAGWDSAPMRSCRASTEEEL